MSINHKAKTSLRPTDIKSTCTNLLKVLDAWKISLHENKVIYPAKRKVIEFGLNKFSNLVTSELDFFNKVENPESRNSNIPYFKALHDCIIQSENILGLLETLTWTEHKNESKAAETAKNGISGPLNKKKGSKNKAKISITIDIISEGGNQWLKLINKTASSYWKQLSILEAEIFESIDISDNSSDELAGDENSNFVSGSNDNNTDTFGFAEQPKHRIHLIETKNGTVWDVSEQAILLLPFFKNISQYIRAANNFLVNFKAPKVVFLFKAENYSQHDTIYKEYSEKLFDKIKKLLNQRGIEARIFNNKYDDLYNEIHNTDSKPVPFPNWSFGATQSESREYGDRLDTTHNQINPDEGMLAVSNRSKSSTNGVYDDSFSHLGETLLLDITTVCALVSITSHESRQIDVDPKFYTPWLDTQRADEEHHPILDIFSKMFLNRKLITTLSVYNRIHKTASEVGGRNEFARFLSMFSNNPNIEECIPPPKFSAAQQGAPLSPSIEELWDSWLKLATSKGKIPHIQIVDSDPSDRINQLYDLVNNPKKSKDNYCKKNFSKLHLDVFGTADKLNTCVTTANLGVCGLISRSGIYGIVIETHAARSLSEPRLYANLVPKKSGSAYFEG